MIVLKNILILLLLILVQSHSLYSMDFPTIMGKTLSNKRIKVPRDYQGKYCFIILGFEEDHKEVAEGWFEPFDVFFKDNDGITYLALPMIGPSFFNFIKYKVIRSNVSERYYGNVMVYPKRISRVLEPLKIDTTDQICLFLLNPKGEIIWSDKGAVTPEKKRTLYSYLIKKPQKPINTTTSTSVTVGIKMQVLPTGNVK